MYDDVHYSDEDVEQEFGGAHHGRQAHKMSHVDVTPAVTVEVPLSKDTRELLLSW